ncbi:hypothetical protein ScPMuIL_006314 [Solemya velum]
MKICVVGAGVIGLSSALHIQEICQNVEITLMSEKFSPETTSDVSGGFWTPFTVDAVKQPIIRSWAKETLDYMFRLCRSIDAGEVGAQLLSGYYLPKTDQWFKDIVLGYRDMTEEELQLFPNPGGGVFFTSASVDVKSYLPWLMSRFKANGGRVLKIKVNTLAELSPEYDIVVNCCGVWAGDVTVDSSVRPIRGQLLRVHAPWIKHFIFNLSSENYAYIIPGAYDVVLGGTFEEDDWNEKPDSRVRERILNNCSNLFPSLKAIKFSSDWTGLRPARPTIRLELESIQTPTKTSMVVHNYGHGGSGVTLHWGCAREAAKIVAQAIHTLSTRPKL